MTQTIEALQRQNLKMREALEWLVTECRDEVARRRAQETLDRLELTWGGTGQPAAESEVYGEWCI